jgi:glyoxylase-like metal-dependent hydrolase (beta-lactamase superfamily II)
MAQVHDHDGGVRSVQVPIPDNPLGHTLVYVVDTDRGPVLVDTGWDDPDSWDALVAGVTACGFALADLHGVLITHHHPDHHGLSAKVREASGAWLAGRTSGPRDRPRRAARSAGAPAARDLDAGAHPGPCVSASGGGAPRSAAPRLRPALLR